MSNKEKLLGNLNKGLHFVLSAPAGCGKNTLLEMLMKEFYCVQESISCTTRKIRPGEIDGVHYNFLSVEDFEEKIAADEFLEYAKYCDNYYGTLKSEVENKRNKGYHVVSVIEVQGAMQIKEKCGDSIFIFVSPPSAKELQNRLEKRHTDSEKSIHNRLLQVKKEMGHISKYDYCVVNDDLDVAYQVFRAVFIAEERKT